MNAGEIHRYIASLKKGDFLRATFDQDPVKGKEIDIAIRVLSPQGFQLCEVDSPTNVIGSEDVFLFAEQDGLFTLEVDGSGKFGVYRARRFFIRRGVPSDRRSAEAECLYFNGLAKERKWNYAGAVANFRAAELRWNELGNVGRRADALSEAGFCRYREEKFVESIALLFKAIGLYHTLGKREKESSLVSTVGRVQLRLGNLDEAQKSADRALELALVASGGEGKANAYALLGAIAEQKGAEFLALDLYDKSLSEWKLHRGREVDQIRALEALGRINAVLGSPKDAMEKFEEAELIADQIDDNNLRGESLVNIAEVLRVVGEPENALAYAVKSLAISKAANNFLALAKYLNDVALIYRDLKRFDEAKASEEEALAVYRSRKDPRNEATAHYNLGLILLETKDLRGATDHFRRAVELSRSTSFSEGEIAGRYGLALGYRLMDDPKAARSQVEIALDLIETASTVTASAGVGSALMESRFGSFQLLIDLIAQLPSITETEKNEAFEASERARWRILLDSLHFGGNAAMIISDNALLADLKDKEIQLSNSEKERKEAEDFGKPTKELRDAQDRLERSISTREARMRSHAFAPRLSPVDLGTTQSLLGSDTILLAYFIGRSRSSLWRVTSASNEMFTIGGRSELEEVCRSFHSLLSVSSPHNEKKIDVAIQEVSRRLLGPVAGRLKAKRIVVIADGPLNYVPFGLLRDPQGHGKAAEPLLAASEIVYEPSMSVLRAIRAEEAGRKRPPHLLAVIANPKFQAERYPPLPYSGEEAKALMHMVPKGGGFSAVGCEATRTLLLKKDFSVFRYLHLATHGEDHPGVAALSGVVLSSSDCAGRKIDDGILRLQDIKNLNLPVDMVVLSACRTALGKEVEGEGFEGLTEGFIAAGSARVVASLWNVDDRFVTSLMTRFYEGIIEEKLSPSQALRIAQLSMAKDGRWKSPYYWAGFKLHGEWRRDP